MSDLRRGRIVRVEVLDPQNRNPKIRPAIILTPTEEIRPDGDLVLVAITGSVNAAPADVEVTLPWHRQGRTTTRLNKPSVAVCTWVSPAPFRAFERWAESFRPVRCSRFLKRSKP